MHDANRAPARHWHSQAAPSLGNKETKLQGAAELALNFALKLFAEATEGNSESAFAQSWEAVNILQLM
jgi:hypothetical protein